MGYLIVLALFAAVWALTNLSPGWQTLPFLTGEFTQVLPAFNLLLASGIGANVTLLLYDPRWFKAALGLSISGLGVYVSLRLLRVFPFSFETVHYDFTTHVTVALLVALVAAAAVAVVNLFALGNAAMRAASAASATRRPRRQSA